MSRARTDKLSHPSQKSEWVEQGGVLTRRQVIQSLGAVGAVALTGCYGDATYEVDRSIFTYWQAEAVRYERDGVFTKADPGDYEGKEDAHTPKVTIYQNNTAVVATVDHPMDIDHWVEAIYFKDQNGDVFYLEHFGYQDAKNEGKVAETFIAIPQGVTEVTGYAFCNKHGTWRSEPVARA